MNGLLKGLFNFDNTTPRPDRLSTISATLSDIGAAFDGREGEALARNTARFEKRQKSEAEKAQQAEMLRTADELGLTPREKFLLMVNPDKFAELSVSQQSPYSLGRGQVRQSGDGTMIGENADYQTIGDQIVRQDSTGVTPAYTRGKTIKELMDERKFDFDKAQTGTENQFRRQQLGISQGQLGVAQGNLGLSRERMKREFPNAEDEGPWSKY